jgi:hypothetical protein
MQCNSVNWPMIGKGVRVASKSLIQLLFIKGFTVLLVVILLLLLLLLLLLIPPPLLLLLIRMMCQNASKKVTTSATRTHWLSPKLDFVSN